MTTDFDKALRSVDAPFTLALGFVGARVDHGLAVFNSLVRHADSRCIVIGPRDVIFHAPRDLTLGTASPATACRCFRWPRSQGAAAGWNGPSTGWISPPLA